jgi:hypothetical protein
MIYNKSEEKQQIRRELNKLFIEHDTNLRSYCARFGYSYGMLYQKLTTNSISHELVNEIIANLDKKRSLQMQNKKLVIIRSF